MALSAGIYVHIQKGINMLRWFEKIKSNKILALILFGSFLVCLVYAFVFKINPVVDAKAYDKIAQNILAGNGFVEEAGMDIKFDKAIIRVGPLYQYFLSGIYAVFGRHFEVVWVLQAVLHVFSAYLVFLIALLLFAKYEQQRQNAALLATGIFAFFPDLIEISAMLMTETLYLFLWILLVWYFIFILVNNGLANNGSWRQVIILGVIAGLAVLARPPVLFVLPVIGVYFLFKKNYKLFILLIFSIALVITPWTVRNYKAYGKIMPFGGAGAYNFWIGNHDGASGEQDKPEEVEKFIVERGAYLVGDESIKQFKNFLYEQPLDFARLTILRINRYFSVIRPMGFWFYDSGLSQLAFILSSAVASLLLFIFSLYGILKIWREKNEAISYLFWMILFTPLILFITVVETRYRFQIYPLLAIFAGYGLIMWLAEANRMKDKHFWIAVLAVCLNGLLDLSLSVEKFFDKLRLFI